MFFQVGEEELEAAQRKRARRQKLECQKKRKLEKLHEKQRSEPTRSFQQEAVKAAERAHEKKEETEPMQKQLAADAKSAELKEIDYIEKSRVRREQAQALHCDCTTLLCTAGTTHP